MFDSISLLFFLYQELDEQIEPIIHITKISCLQIYERDQK